MPQPKDPYKILGVSPSASEKEIRNAYRKLVLKYHPDRNQNSRASEEKFNEIQRAYELLKKADHQSIISNTYTSNTKTFYKKVKDVFRLRIILTKAEVAQGVFKIKVFSLHKVEQIELKLPTGIKLIEKKAPENIILTTANTPTVAWNTTYVLLASKTGHLQIGPASYIHEGVKYESEKAFINVYTKEAFTKKQKSEKKLNRTMLGVALTFVFMLTMAMAYNIIMDQIDPARNATQPKIEANIINENRLQTGASPYAYYYGNNIKSLDSEHEIEFIADPILDQIVFLVDFNTNQVIRHNYILSGDTFNMNNIPDGIYYTKVFYGRDWNSKIKITKRQLLGGFNLYRKFISFSSKDQLLQMKKTNRDDSLAYNAYRITLFKVSGGEAKANEIEENQFF